MKLSHNVFFIFLLTSTSAYAEVKPLYTYWSLGYAKHTYSGTLKTAVNAFTADNTTQRTNHALDLFGFYVPLSNNQTIIGFVSNILFDSLSNSSGTLTINQYNAAISTMHFYGNEPGEGLFFRGDYGRTQIAVDPATGISASGKSGTGYLIGTGIGFTLPNGNHLVLSFNYSDNQVDNESFIAKQFTVGMLW